MTRARGRARRVVTGAGGCAVLDARGNAAARDDGARVGRVPEATACRAAWIVSLPVPAGWQR